MPNSFAQAGTAVWSTLRASLQHAEREMTFNEKAAFWDGMVGAAMRDMAASIGATAARERLQPRLAAFDQQPPPPAA